MMKRLLAPELRRLLDLLRPWRGAMLVGAALAVLAALAAVGLMAIAGWFLAAMAVAGVAGTLLNYYTPAAAIRAFAILRTGGRYGERLSTHDATLRALAGLRAWLFRRVIPLAPARLAALRSAELFARLRADVDALEHFYLGAAIPLLVAFAGTVVAVALAAWVLPVAALVLLVATALAGWGVPAWVRRRTAQDAEAEVREAAELRSLLLDALQGHAELLAWGGVQAHAERIAALDERLAARRRRVEGAAARGAAGVAWIAQWAVAVLLVFGLAAVHAGSLGGTLLALLVLLLLAAFEWIAPLPEALGKLQTTAAAARRIFELVDTRPAVTEPAHGAEVVPHPALVFDAARLRYAPDAPWALDGLSLALAPGERLAIVGDSGAGKTSLLNVLQRFYPLEGGRILLGGEPLDRLCGKDARRCVAVVGQRVQLFNRSLRDNLLLAAPQADASDLARVAQEAQLAPFIARLPAGWDTPLGEGGAQVSGGEARRIAVARALLQDAPILALDEPTEGLDAATAAALYQALAGATHGRSVLLITHRLGQLATLVDRVAVLRAGRIVATMDVAEYLARQRMAHQTGAACAPEAPA